MSSEEYNKSVTRDDSKPSVDNIRMHRGYHSLSARIQKETLAHSFTVAREQCARLPLPEGRAFTLVDLGTADGVNSLPLFRGCIKTLRERRDASSGRDTVLPIQIVFEDLPTNTSGFQAIASLGFHHEYEHVYPLISAISFFEPCVPPESADLIFSSHAMHYLSKVPCNFTTTGLKDTDAQGAEKSAFAAQATRDWEAILRARAIELAPGGRCVISNLCVDERNGWYYCSTDRGASIYSTISRILSEMVDEGLLTAEEFAWATSPEYYRTQTELKAPFESESLDLKLVSMHVHVTRCPINADFVAGKFGADSLAFGKALSNAMSSFCSGKIQRAFRHPNNQRAQEEQQDLLTETFDRFARAAASTPAAYGIDNVCAVMVIEKPQ